MAVETTSSTDDPRLWTVQPGRCRLVLGTGWDARFTLRPDEPSYIIRTRSDVGTVAATADPRRFRAEDPSIVEFEAWVVDDSASPAEEQTLSNPSGDCLLQNGRLQVRQVAGRESTCTVDVSDPSTIPDDRLTLIGSDGLRAAVTPGPGGAGQILDCLLAENVTCTDRTNGGASVPHPLAYPGPTAVSVTAEEDVSFGLDCETQDPRSSSLTVDGDSSCQLARRGATEDDGAVAIRFPEAGGSVEVLDLDSGQVVQTCAFTEATSDAVVSCRFENVPRRLAFRAGPDGAFTRFVGFRSPVGLDTDERGCAATAMDRFEQDLTMVEVGLAPSNFTYVCEAVFEYTDQAALNQAILSIEGMDGSGPAVAFDLENADSTLCPVQTPAFWSCRQGFDAAALPDPFTVVPDALSDGAARLPTEFSAGGPNAPVGSFVSGAPPPANVQVTFRFNGVSYSLEAVPQ